MHPERNTDVVIFLDTFVEARREDAGTLDLAVRAAATLAERYLAHRDRVGLVVFGGILNWLTPATGIVQRYRIVDALLDAEILLSYAWKDIDVVPRRTLRRRRSSLPCRRSSTSAHWRRSPTCAGAASTSR